MIIVLMLVKIFNLSCDVSKLADKVEQLAQEIALHEKDDEDHSSSGREK